MSFPDNIFLKFWRCLLNKPIEGVSFRAYYFHFSQGILYVGNYFLKNSIFINLVLWHIILFIQVLC